MAVVFTQGQQLGPNDLSIRLYDGSGNPFNPHRLYYEFYGYDHLRGEWRVGQSDRTPTQTEAGVYFVSEKLTTAMIAGNYVVVWVMQRDPLAPLEVVKRQEFAFIGVGI